MFKNRKEAGKLLLKKLTEAIARRKQLSNVIVALPRGGVPVAAEIARVFRAPLTVLVSKKISAPFQPEYAIGAVSSSGVVVLNEDSGIPHEALGQYIASEQRRLGQLTRDMELKWLAYSGRKEQLDFNQKRAIIVDDGIATGMTVLAAADSLKALGAAEVLIATPVLATESRELLASHCNEIVCVLEPTGLGAIGLFYEDFHQVMEEEVIDALGTCAQFN